MRLICHTFIIKIEVIPWAVMLGKVFVSSRFSCCTGMLSYSKGKLQFAILCGEK